METAARTRSRACRVAPPVVAVAAVVSVSGSVGSGLAVAARTAALGDAVMNVGSTEISPSGGVPSSVGTGVAVCAGSTGAALSLAAGSAARTARDRGPEEGEGECDGCD